MSKPVVHCQFTAVLPGSLGRLSPVSLKRQINCHSTDELFEAGGDWIPEIAQNANDSHTKSCTLPNTHKKKSDLIQKQPAGTEKETFRNLNLIGQPGTTFG